MATSSLARQVNELKVLKTLFEGGPMTRAEVARRLDLTKSTMTNVIGSLIAENLIRDSAMHAGRGKVGRPGIQVGVNAAGAYFIGVELRVGHIKVAALDLDAHLVGGRVVVEEGVPLEPTATLDRLRSVVETHCASVLPQNADIRGICIGLPGFLTLDGLLLRAPRFGWHHLPVLRELEARFEWPVVVENDANLAAFAEYYLNQDLRGRDIAMISLTRGVGCGLIQSGKIVRGAHGFSGELGHLFLDEQRRGTFDTESLTWEQAVDEVPMLRAFAERTSEPPNLDALVAAYHRSDPVAVDLVGVWVRWMARGLLATVYAYDPDDVVVGGELAPLFAVAKPAIEDQLSRMLISDFPAPRLLTSSFGANGCATGAAALMHAGFFKPLSIESAIS
jgi:predicted NBD/HSP70 family sugar kinase